MIRVLTAAASAASATADFQWQWQQMRSKRWPACIQCPLECPKLWARAAGFGQESLRACTCDPRAAPCHATMNSNMYHFERLVSIIVRKSFLMLCFKSCEAEELAIAIVLFSATCRVPGCRTFLFLIHTHSIS